MRTALIALAALPCFVAISARSEIEIRPENKTIANAAYVLHQTNEYNSNKLEIISSDRAVFTGGSDGPVLVARLDKCTYAIKSRGKSGFKLDFSKLHGNYYFERDGYQSKMIFPGEGVVSCYLNDNQADVCFKRATFYRAASPQTETFLASISYIMENGCPAVVPPQPKPRF